MKAEIKETAKNINANRSEMINLASHLIARYRNLDSEVIEILKKIAKGKKKFTHDLTEYLVAVKGIEL